MSRTIPSERQLTPAAKRPPKRRLSSGASLLEVVELGGGSATDLVQALMEADPDDGEAAMLASALRTAKRHRAGEDAPVPATKQERKAARRSRRVRSRSADLIAFMERSGGSPAALIDVLAERGGAVKDLELASAALDHALPAAAAGGGAEAADADTGDTISADAAPGQTRNSSDAEKMCTVCRDTPCAAGDKKACGICRAFADRLKAKSGGLCKLKHLRVAVAEHGSDAKRGALKRRALQLAGVPPAADPDAEADAAAEAEHAAEEAPAAEPSEPPAARAAPDGTGGTAVISLSSSQEEEGSEVGEPVADPHVARKPERSAADAVTGAGTQQAFEGKPRLKTPQRDGDARTHVEKASAAAAASPAKAGEAAASKQARTVRPEAASSTQRQESASGTAAAAAREVKLCAICDDRPRSSGSYCAACTLIGKSLFGRGKTGLIRAALKELGKDANRAAVKAHVQRAQEKAASAKAAEAAEAAEAAAA